MPQDGQEKGADRAYQRLRTEIFSGLRRGGERLSEVGLAAQLGLSRTPVRAALHRLEADGLIHWQAHRSPVVRQWSRHDAREILEVRALLESAAAGQAARHAGAEDCDRLEALCEEMESMAGRPGPSPEITVVNRHFHVELLRLAGNARQQEIASDLMDLGLLIQTYTAASAAEVERSMRHHREIVAALRNRNPAWAESVMRAHIEAATTLYAGD